MTPERWRQVEALYHGLLDLPAADRRSLLEQADAEVRLEVEGLLEQNGSLLDRLAGEDLDIPLTAASTATDFAPDQLGPYKIERQIGSGGMGRVFRAQDTRLNRAVAIKTSSERFGKRFEREARAIAQLNHPHICTLYDVGPNYIVMELIEGETLAARLKRGALPSDQVFKFGGQVADALAAAHSKGIVHRDLKPGNIMIAKAGVKVLDFGIARLAHDETLTASRMVIGTPAYMSPEQREGCRCDARSDIYALGVVLREMATGDRAGDLDRLPPQLAHVVERCLEADPADRWQAASDVRKELEWAAAIRATAPVSAVTRLTTRLAWTIAALVSLVLLVVGGVLYRQRSSRNSDRSEFILTLNQHGEDVISTPLPSPDGRLLAFPSRDLMGVTSIWIRPLDSVDARRLAGTEGSAGDLVWSPDGEWIAFFADGKLKRVRQSGGLPETIAPIAGFQDAAWGSKGDIVFRPSNRVALFRIRDTGGTVQPLTKLNVSLTENSHRYPTFLPDGRHFLFVSRCGDRANNALYFASLDSQELKKIMPAQARVSYIQDAVVFYRDGTLVAQAFDADRAQLSGEAVPILTGVAYNAPSIQAAFRTSQKGEVLIAGSAASTDTSMVWYSRNGEAAGRLGEPGHYAQPRISPDGTRVAFYSPDPQTGNRDIWSMEIARGITSRLTTHVANDWFPVWSPDGTQIAFASDRAGGPALNSYLKTSMDPGSNETHLGPPLPLGIDVTVSDWSRDGKWMAFVRNGLDILVAPATAPGNSFDFIATPARETNARFSPDGKWIAYVSNESGRTEIYVRPFSGAPAGPAGKVQISVNGGEYPVWSPTGEELYYMSADSSIYASDTRSLGSTKPIQPPARLFQACPGTEATGPPASGDPYSYAFDTHDGKKFLVVCRVEPAGRFTVLMNWNFRR